MKANDRYGSGGAKNGGNDGGKNGANGGPRVRKAGRAPKTSFIKKRQSMLSGGGEISPK